MRQSEEMPEFIGFAPVPDQEKPGIIEFAPVHRPTRRKTKLAQVQKCPPLLVLRQFSDWRK